MNNDAILNSTYFISYNNTYIINGSNIEFNISYKDIYNNDSITSTYYNNIEIFGYLYTYSNGSKVENNNVASSLEDNIDIDNRDEYGCYANVAYELYNKIEETYKSYIEGNSLYDAIILNSYSYSYFSNYKDAKDNHNLKWMSYNNKKPSKINISYSRNNLFNLYGNTYYVTYNSYISGDYITNNYGNTKIENVNLSLENINVSYSNNINVDNDENILYIDKLNIKNCLSKPIYKALLHKSYYSCPNNSYPKDLKNIFGNDIEIISNDEYNRIYSVEEDAYFDLTVIKPNSTIISYINSSSKINTIGMELYVGDTLIDAIYKKGYCQGSDNNSYYSLSIPNYYYYSEYNIKYLCEDISGELNINNSTLYIGVVNYDDKYNKDIKNKKYQLLSNELNRLDKDKTKISINIPNDISYSYISDNFLKYKYKYSNLLFDYLSPNFFNIFNYDYIRNIYCATIPDYNSNFLYNNGYMCMSYNSTKLSYNNISLGLNKILYPVINSNNIIKDIAYNNTISYNHKICSIYQICDNDNIGIYTNYKITYTNNNITSDYYGNSPIIYLNYRNNNMLLYSGSKDLIDFPIVTKDEHLIKLREYYSRYTQNSSYSNIFNDNIYKKDTRNLPLVKYNDNRFIYGILVNQINRLPIKYNNNEHFQYTDILSFNQNPIKYNIVKGDLENITSKEIIISSPKQYNFPINGGIDQNLCSYIINNDKYLYDESLIKLDYCDNKVAYTHLYPTDECYNNYHLLYYTLEDNIKKYTLLNIITIPYTNSNNKILISDQKYLTLLNINKKTVTIYNRNYPLTIYNNIENNKKTLYIYVCSLRKDIWATDTYTINNVYYFYTKAVDNLYIHLHEQDLEYINNTTNIINNTITASNKFENAIIISDKTLEEANYNLDKARIIYYRYY